MDFIKTKTRKEVDIIWENKLKLSFFQYINKYSTEALKEVQNELRKTDNSIKSQIQEFGRKFDEKWNKKFNIELSKIEQIKSNIKNKEQKLIIINNEDNSKSINNENDDDNGEYYLKLRKKMIKIEELKYPPLINLNLLPQTNPLINIILFCLSNNKYIVSYYLNPEKEEKILKKYKENPKNDYLIPSFLKMLDYLWKSNKKEYSPSGIHHTLKKLMMNNYFSNNPGLIINFILIQLHEELIVNKQINNNENNSIYDHFDKITAFKTFFKKFKESVSKISDLFYCIIKTKKICNNCCTPTYYFEGSSLINIFLKSNKINKFNNLSFNEHLKYLLMNQEENYIIEYCSVCKSDQKLFVMKEIYSTSFVVIIYINREKDKDYNVSFKYPETFEGNKIINNNLKLPNYQLNCVIKIKRNKNFEYIALLKNFIDNRWYSYNNEKIELIKDDYKNHIFDEKNSCLLIYCKI